MPVVIPEALTPAESVRLVELERVIERGKTAFLETGEALAEIRASQLYRVSHATFEAYFQERLGLEKSHVQRLMAAAKAVGEISKSSPTGEVPKNEAQARPLTALKEPEQQVKAWEKAVEKAAEEGKPVTARHVEAAVAELDEEEEAPVAVTPETTPERGVGLFYARSAVNALNKIPKRDASRKEAIQMITEWLEKNR